VKALASILRAVANRLDPQPAPAPTIWTSTANSATSAPASFTFRNNTVG
jgi:hypothetical protein